MERTENSKDYSFLFKHQLQSGPPILDQAQNHLVLIKQLLKEAHHTDQIAVGLEAVAENLVLLQDMILKERALMDEFKCAYHALKELQRTLKNKEENHLLESKRTFL